ncbi:MAG: hypothetical protein KDD84_01115 [Caldilineaceae bacterium]|nr:hypothetical protein [Caldilineaceae bacterium]
MTIRFAIFVLLILWTGLMSACAAAPDLAAALIASAVGNDSATVVVEDSAEMATDDEMLFGSTGGVQLDACFEGGACYDVEGYEYLCDAEGFCVDEFGDAWICGADGFCTFVDINEASTGSSEQPSAQAPANDAAASSNAGGQSAPSSASQGGTVQLVDCDDDFVCVDESENVFTCSELDDSSFRCMDTYGANYTCSYDTGVCSAGGAGSAPAQGAPSRPAAASQPSAPGSSATAPSAVSGSPVQLVNCDDFFTCVDESNNVYLCAEVDDNSFNCVSSTAINYTCSYDTGVCNLRDAGSAPAVVNPPAQPSGATANTGGNTAAPTAGGVSDAQIGELLAAHNRWRAEVGVPPLIWSAELALSSQQWADNLAANGGGLQHASGPFGENLSGSTGAQSATQAVDNWGSEKAQFNYNNEPIDNQNYKDVGHYTQIVWRATTEVGCGVAQTASGGTVWVCRYSPAGNMTGQSPY